MPANGRHFIQFTKLSSYDLDLHNLDKIIRFFSEAHLEGNELKKEDLEKNPLTITLWGINGECFVYFNADMSSITDYPNNIKRIQITNSTKTREYRIQNGPSHFFQLTLDLTTVAVFDLLTRPSEETKNDSSLEVSGYNESWVSGVQGRTMTQLNQIKNWNYLIHKNHIYDFILFFLIFPTTLLILRNNQTWTDKVFGPSLPTQLIGTLFMFLIIGTAFRLIFNWKKWLFPINVLILQESKFRKLQKAIILFFIITFISVFISNKLNWI